MKVNFVKNSSLETASGAFFGRLIAVITILLAMLFVNPAKAADHQSYNPGMVHTPVYTLDHDVSLTLYNKGGYLTNYYLYYGAPNGELVSVEHFGVPLWQTKVIDIPAGASNVHLIVKALDITWFSLVPTLWERTVVNQYIDNDTTTEVGSSDEVIFHFWGTSSAPKWSLVG